MSEPFDGLPGDYPCRTCGDPEDFEYGIERCDDEPCETLLEYFSAHDLLPMSGREAQEVLATKERES